VLDGSGVTVSLGTGVSVGGMVGVSGFTSPETVAVAAGNSVAVAVVVGVPFGARACGVYGPLN